jgi:hypothetical protein
LRTANFLRCTRMKKRIFHLQASKEAQ